MTGEEEMQSPSQLCDQGAESGRPGSLLLSRRTETTSSQRLLPGFQASEPQSKGVWEPRMVGCTSAAGSRPNPAPAAWDPCRHYGGAGVFLPLREMETDASLKLSGVRWTTDSPPGNTLLPEKTRQRWTHSAETEGVRTAERPGKGELCSKVPF